MHKGNVSGQLKERSLAEISTCYSEKRKEYTDVTHQPPPSHKTSSQSFSFWDGTPNTHSDFTFPPDSYPDKYR